MKPKASMCGVIAVAAIIGIAGGSGNEGSRASVRGTEPDLQKQLDTYVGQLKRGGVEQRREAVLAIGRIGERGNAAAPALAKVLQSKDFWDRKYAAEALWKINKNPAAVAAMLEDLQDRDWNMRSEAASTLGRFGVEAKAAVPALSDALHDASRFVRISAALALWQIDKHPDAIPTLVENLEGPNRGHTACAAVALGQIGVEAKAAVPALREALENKPPDTAVASALWKINKDASAVPALVEGLKSREAGWRASSANALASIGVDAKAAVPALIEALQDEKSFVSRSAAEALGAMGVEAKAAAPALVEALEGQKGRTRVSAAEALWRINKHRAAVPALAKALEDPTDQAAAYAHFALRRIGAEAKAAVPALTEALKAGNVILRVEAAVTLWQIDKDPAVVPVLVRALEHLKVTGYARIAAVVLLNKDLAGVPDLNDALNIIDVHRYVRVYAAKALWQINKHPAAVSALVEALEDVGVCAEAGDALWQINKHPRAVPALIETLQSHDGAILALGRVGVEAKAAVAALTDALKDEDEAVRNSAAKWLVKIGPEAMKKAGVK